MTPQGRGLSAFRRRGRLRCGGNRAEMIVFLMLLGLMGYSALPATAAAGSEVSGLAELTSPSQPSAQYARLPLSFELNQGQTDPRAKFLARGKGYTLFLASDEAVLALRPKLTPSPAGGFTSLDPSVVRMKLVGTAAEARISGMEELPAESNYFVGSDAKGWHLHIPTFGKVQYSGLYHGIDLVYYGRQGRLEYDFVAGPSSDVGRILLRIDGAERMRVNRAGDLVLEAGRGELRFERPKAYQIIDGRSRSVAARYVLRGKTDVGFRVAEYDHRQPLIIDPVLTYATYLGGAGSDVANGVAVDASGNAYVTGTTGSISFPTTSAYQDANAGGGDVFVAKLNPAGTGLVYSTFLGGTGTDIATGIAIDSSGNAYIAGDTSSTNFPTTSNAFQSTYGGNGDAFFTKLGATGSTLLYSSYLGGSGQDFGQAIAVDSSGNAYLTGSTQSSDFPTASPLQIGNDNCTTINTTISSVQICSSDVFVAKINPSGSGLASLVYSTYLGGSSADFGQAIAVDGSGNAYVAGYTYSKDFPTQNALYSGNAGGVDAFLTEVNAAGSALIFSTYLGGNGQDRAFGLALDAVGALYLTGDTQSNDFPTTANAFQPGNAGQGDAFVCKFTPGASQLLYSTFLGGTNVDQGTAITLDSSGNAYVTGSTASSDFPTADPLQKILGISGAGSCGTGTCTDAFVAELRPSGQLVYSTYLGGSGADAGEAIAVDSSGQAHVVGSTSSPNFPAIAGALQGAYLASGPSSNAFIAKISSIDAPALGLNPQQLSFGDQAVNNPSQPATVTLINAGSSPLNINAIQASGDFTQTNNCGSTVPAGSGTCTMQVTFTPTTTGTRTDQISITDNAAGSPHQITVTGNGVLSSQGALTFTPSTLSFPAETVGTTSPAEIVRVANTGKAALTISSIIVSGDFAETNTCGTLPSVLNVGDGCTVTITFTPASSGSRTGSLTISSNAASGSKGVSLSGTGNAVFSLSASTRSTTVIIGTKANSPSTPLAAFTINVLGPSSFAGSITLSCSSGATCTFDPTSVYVGGSTTLTLSALTTPSTGPAPPVNLTITGTSGGQTASVVLTIFFKDFTISATPPFDSITGGNSAGYTVTVTPSNGFNGVVQLGCQQPMPASDMTCTWAPPALQLQGAPLTATLSVNTVAQKLGHVTRRPPSGPGTGPGSRIKFILWMLCLVALVLLAAAKLADRRRLGSPVPARLAMYLRLASVGVMLCAAALTSSCNNYYQQNNFTPPAGTPPGAYTVTLTGALGTNSSVVRSTTVNLAVQ